MSGELSYCRLLLRVVQWCGLDGIKRKDFTMVAVTDPAHGSSTRGVVAGKGPAI